MKNKLLGIDPYELFSLSIRYLTLAIESKDVYTLGHSERVKDYSMAIGERYGLSKKELANLFLGSLLHDIGKVRVPEKILRKQDKLTNEERTIMQKHVLYAQYIIGYNYLLSEVNKIIKYHHERWDGSGYLEGLKENEIPIGAQIVAIADSFDAMTTNRGYNEKKSIGYAVNEIKNKSGIHYNPKLVDIFVRLYEEGYIHYLKAKNYLKTKEKNSWQESLLNFKEAYKLNGDPKLKFDILLQILKILNKERNEKEAEIIIDKIENLSSKYEIPLTPSYLNEKALYFYYAKKYDDAQRISEQIISVRDIEKFELARAHRHLALCFWKQHLDDGALTETAYSEEIYLDLMKELYEMDFSEVKEDVQLYKLLLERHEKIDEIIKNFGKLYDVYGRIYFAIGNFPKSIEYFNKSIEKKNEIMDDYGLSLSYSGRGELKSIMNKFDEAHSDFLISKRIFSELNITYSIYLVYIEMVKNYLRMGNFEEAEVAIREMKKSFTIDDNFNLISAYYQYKIENYDRTLKILENIDIKNLYRDKEELLYYFLLGKAYLKKNMYTKAKEIFEKLVEQAYVYKYFYFQYIYLNYYVEILMKLGDNKVEEVKTELNRIKEKLLI